MNKKILLLSLLVMQIPIDASENHNKIMNKTPIMSYLTKAGHKCLCTMCMHIYISNAYKDIDIATSPFYFIIKRRESDATLQFRDLVRYHD